MLKSNLTALRHPRLLRDGRAADSGLDADFHVPERLRVDRTPALGRSRIGPCVLDAMLALGLVLSTATQFRPHGLPIGLGEVCMTTWLVLMLGREAMRLGPPLTPALSRLLIFWALFTIALCVGTMTAFALHDKHDPVWFMHDVVAYPFLAGLSCLSVVEPHATHRLRRVAWLVATLGAASLAIQLTEAWGWIAIPHVDSWYWNRFRGWSDNPEQLALLCLALTLLSIHLADTAATVGGRIGAVMCAILPIYVGRLTQTDTFTIVLLVCAPVFVALKLRTWLRSSGPKVTLRSAVAWMAVLALPLILTSVVPLASSITDRSAIWAKTMLKDNGKEAAEETALRLRLWHEAWDRGVEAWMLGLGPGPHLNTPESLKMGRASELPPLENIIHPAVNGTANFEAHNTALDLFAQGGVLALLAFFWLVGTALFSVYRAGLASLTILLGGLLLFGMTVLIIRQPIFWFAIALCLVGGTRPSHARHAYAPSTTGGSPWAASSLGHPNVSSHLRVRQRRAETDMNPNRGLA
jgi:hypothetical protein